MSLLPDYQVRARNCAADSENTIHGDDAARQFGFRGGLVPGVVVFGYAIKPVIDFYGQDWLERGRVHIKLQQPVYEGDVLTVRTEVTPHPAALHITVNAVSAVADAALESEMREPPILDEYGTKSLPDERERPDASREVLVPGTTLGTLAHQLNPGESKVFGALGETNPLFLGSNALVHPAVLLELANRALMRNFRLLPWLHTASTVTNWGVVLQGAEVQVRARIADCFERKGHEFVVLDMVIAEAGTRLIQHIVHTAIYRSKFLAKT